MTEIKLTLAAPLSWVAALRDLHEKIGGASVSPLSQLADQIEEQVKTAEPAEYGSVVRAHSPQEHDQVAHDRWHPSPFHGKHYWQSESGLVEVWSELTDVEVLRVGLGEIPSESQKAAQDDAYVLGRTEGAQKLAADLHDRLIYLLSQAITSERKNALEKAIQAVEELAP